MVKKTPVPAKKASTVISNKRGKPKPKPSAAKNKSKSQRLYAIMSKLCKSQIKTMEGICTLLEMERDCITVYEESGDIETDLIPDVVTTMTMPYKSLLLSFRDAVRLMQLQYEHQLSSMKMLVKD